VLQDLMSMNDVESAIGVTQGVHVADLEAHIAELLGRSSGLIDHVSRPVDTHDRSGRHAGGQASGDGPGSAPDIEHIESGAQRV
jgi:hypothetical protein